MKKTISLLSFYLSLIPLASFAQTYSDELYWAIPKLRGETLRIGHQEKASVQLKGHFNYNSNAVTNDFFSQLVYQSTYISEQDKEGSLKRLKSNNRLGIEAVAALHGTYRFKDTTWLMDIGAAYREFAYGYFTDDVFRLAFQGNAQFEGEHADVGPSMLKEWNYGSIFVGLQKVLNEKYLVGVRLSAIKAGSYRETTMAKGTLYTDEGGAYVELSAPFTWYSQKRPQNPFTANNGWGAGVDLYAQRYFKNSILSFEVKDLGAVKWRNMDTYKGEGTYRYEGQNIGDVLAPGNSYISSIQLDSIAKELGIQKVVQDKTTMLPTRLQLTYLHKLNTKWGLKGDVSYYLFLKGYRPFGRLSAFYAITPALSVVPSVTIGGYGNINTHLGLSAAIANRWFLQANVFALEYFIAPTSYSGHGLELYLTKRF